VVLAGGPLGAWPAALLVRSRLAGALAGRLGVVAAVSGALPCLDPVDGAADSLPVGPLGQITGLGAEGPVGIGDLVAAPVVLVWAAAWRQARRPRVDSGTGPSASRT
jgi:hypothetical protein